VEDAIAAYERGVQGIVLSNAPGTVSGYVSLLPDILYQRHKTMLMAVSSGCSAQAPMVTLLEIRKHAPHILGRCMEIYVNGSIRRGTDVVKVLALGVTAVGVGRPCVYSMSRGYDEAGVRRLF
jgi:L-lactate dehydrogenase (cytochrome)